MRGAAAGPRVPIPGCDRQAFDAALGVNIDLTGAGVRPVVRTLPAAHSTADSTVPCRPFMSQPYNTRVFVLSDAWSSLSVACLPVLSAVHPDRRHLWRFAAAGVLAAPVNHCQEWLD